MKLTYQLPEWINTKSHIVISNRIRFSRNLDMFPFVQHAEQDTLFRVNEEVENAVMKSENFSDWDRINVKDLNFWELETLKEKFLITDINFKSPSVLMYVNKKMNLLLLTNTDDHVKMISMRPEKEFVESFQKLSKMDDSLASNLDYAYHPDFGFLSPSLVDTGTSLKVSILIHLPGINITEKIQDVCSIVSEKGFSLKGFRIGRDIKNGNLFILENNYSFGIKEEDLLNSIVKVLEEIEDKEDKAEDKLFENLSSQIKDKILRSWGILTNAYMLTVPETINLLSALRLGVRMKVFPEKLLATVNRLMVLSLPGHIRMHYGIFDSGEEAVDEYRADFIKKNLENQEGLS